MTNFVPAGGPRIEIVAAVAANGTIGANGAIPWHLPPDLRRFRSLTTGHAVVMGWKTWKSIGKPLPRRENIVVSTSDESPAVGVRKVRSLSEAVVVATRPIVFVIGGEALYREAMSVASALHLTEIRRPFAGDVFFPPIDHTAWIEICRESRVWNGEQSFRFDFVTYSRAASSRRRK